MDSLLATPWLVPAIIAFLALAAIVAAGVAAHYHHMANTASATVAANVETQPTKVQAARYQKVGSKAQLTPAEVVADVKAMTPQQRLRSGVMVVATLILVGGVFFIAKQQIGVLVFKACLMTLASVIGYWIDRTLFPYSRPGDLVADPPRQVNAEYRRALIVAATLLTAGLGA